MLKTSYKFIGLICAVILLAVITPVSTAHAQALFGIPTVSDFIAQGIALIMNQLVALMSLFVMIAGYLLNFSINLTLQIKTFVDSTPAIYTTWRTIRDIAGLTMIFFLLYAAFQLIIGQKSSKFGQLIKNVVFAGIIVNFSFFLAGLGIDASNIVSVQLYNAIAPANSLNPNAAKTAIINGTWRSSVDGGLSDIFMNSLHIQSFYKTKLADNVTANTSKGAAAAQGLNQSVGASFASAPVKIFLMGATAILIEFAAAMSFGAAALAFIFRFIVLLMLLAFSPVWMLDFLPEVKQYSEKWFKMYWSMLIFMPVYLLLMYLALNVLTTSPMFGGSATSAVVNVGNAPGQTAPAAGSSSGSSASIGTGDGTWYNSFVILGVNSAIVIILLNMPLVAAASMAGGTIGLLKKAAGKFDTNAIFGKAGGWAKSGAGLASGYVGSNIIGQTASNLDKAIGKTKLGNSLIARDIRKATTQKVAEKVKFGGERSYKDYKAEAKTTRIKYEEIDRRNKFDAALNSGNVLDLKGSLKTMSKKEKLDLGDKTLSDPAVIRHLKREDYAAIKDSDDFTQNQKDAISAARRNAFTTAVAGKAATSDVTADLLKTYNGEDLLGFDEKILGDEFVVRNLTNGQLKTYGDNSTDQAVKDAIYDTMLRLRKRKIRVPAEGWLREERKNGRW
ncbi:MAG TPA: hypothetical protein VF438_00905 [Candidatus Paceibacterota bacterium]